MRILLAGASGFLGTRLVARLREHGHDVTRLVRRDPGVKELRWDPAGGVLDPSAVAGTDAMINLAGAGVGDHRWTDEYRRTVVSSRLETTGTIVRTIAALPSTDRPAVLLNASAVGYYGDAGDRVLDESAPPADDFLARLCRDWEAATAPAADAGTRVVLLRTGLPLDPAGGLLKPVRLQFLCGAGGRLSTGRQYIPWMSMADWLGAMEFLLTRDDLAGPVNVTGPEPVTNTEFTRVLARRLHRPALIPAPAFALRIALGEFATELLASRRVVPARLTDSGYAFRHPGLHAALADVL